MKVDDLESEMSVIGSILIDDLCVTELDLTENDFFDEKNKIIIKVILELKKENKKIDLISVKEKIEAIGFLEKIGGIDYLLNLTDITPTSANFLLYQEIVRKYSQKQKLQTLLNKCKNNINNGEFNLNENLNLIQNGISEIEKNIKTNDKNIFELLESTHNYIEQIKTKDLVGFSFGEDFKDLNILTGGLERGKIYRIGGGSNMGKSWLLYNLLNNLLEKTDKITFFALENEDNFTMKNLLCNKKGVNPRPDLIKKLKYDFTNEYNFFMEKQNFILTSKYKNLFDIIRTAIRNKSEFIFIDFIQLVEIPGNFFGETEKHSFYSKEIQKFASKYNIGVIDLSQLSNDTQRQGIDGNGSTEFKGGGSLKESCDVGLHLFKDKKKEDLKNSSITLGNKEEQNKVYINLLISKNRLGPGVGTSYDYCLDFNIGGKYKKDLFN